MNTGEIIDGLHLTLSEDGFKWAIVSSIHATELRLTIENSLHNGLISSAVYRQYTAYFDSMLKQDSAWARSIIVVAIPQPMLEVVLTINGEKRSMIIPPTYDHSNDEKVTNLIEQELKSCGYRISPAALPNKLLATHSGLARYGRNNIAYVDGFGSFHRLIAFYTDLPTPKDGWQEPQVLDECTGCRACASKCPTAAIDPNRFQLHAEKCLTLHNESSQAFPSWINESWHHCLVGCMRCQRYCPVNKDVSSRTIRFAEFSNEESAMLLEGLAKDEMPRGLIAKFDKTDLLDDSVALARNLRSVLAASG